MAKKMYEETRIAAVAEKIRELSGSETKYTTATMPEGVEEVGVVCYLAGKSDAEGGSGGTGSVTTVGVHFGSDTPPEGATLWIDPSGEPSSTEEWEFEMTDGSKVTKTVVVTESEG